MGLERRVSACISHTHREEWSLQPHPKPTFQLHIHLTLQNNMFPLPAQPLGLCSSRLPPAVVRVSLHREWVIEPPTCKPLGGSVPASFTNHISPSPHPWQSSLPSDYLSAAGGWACPEHPNKLHRRWHNPACHEPQGPAEVGCLQAPWGLCCLDQLWAEAGQRGKKLLPLEQNFLDLQMHLPTRLTLITITSV